MVKERKKRAHKTERGKWGGETEEEMEGKEWGMNLIKTHHIHALNMRNK